MMKPELTHEVATDAYILQRRYTLPHRMLTLTFTIVAQPDQPPLLYITNETDQIHRRPRCIRALNLFNATYCYFYERACVDIYGDKHYEVECHVIDHNPHPAEPDIPRWTVHTRLTESREIHADGESHYGTLSETDTL